MTQRRPDYCSMVVFATLFGGLAVLMVTDIREGIAWRDHCVNVGGRVADELCLSGDGRVIDTRRP